MKIFRRKTLQHAIPDHVDPYSIFFVTICCEKRGENVLCTEAVFENLLNTVLFYHQSHKWFVHLFLFMPDHVHALLGFNAIYILQNPIRKNLVRKIEDWPFWWMPDRMAFQRNAAT